MKFNTFFVGAVVGLVCGLLALFVAGWALANAAGTVTTIETNVALVTKVTGYISLVVAFGAWVAKANDTTGGFLAMTARETAAPGALALTGAILIAL
jgi:hypothetical protein